MIRTVDPNCRECGRALLDDLSRRRRVGPDCWRRMTPDEQRRALELAAAERDPHHIPEARPASATARINNRDARRAVDAPDTGRLCRHENLAGACPDCRREADPHRAAERILRDVLAQTFEARRAERLEVLARRYAHGPPPVGRRPPKPRPARPAPAPTPPKPVAVQMELM